MLQAVLSGILEGLTEFIPVSSTAHLIIFGKYIQPNNSTNNTFEIFIQLGAILAVLVLYYKRFLELLNFKNNKLANNQNSFSGGFSGVSGIIKISLACIPVFILGAFGYSHIKELLNNIYSILCALIVGGVLMILVEKLPIKTKVKSLEEISFKQSFLIGLSQCFALWPGFSRSGSTIIGAMLLGIKREVAAEFSFLVAVPVILAASLFDLLKNIQYLSKDDYLLLFVGLLVSFVVAIFSIKFFLNILKRFSLTVFGYYRIILSIVIFFYLI